MIRVSGLMQDIVNMLLPQNVDDLLADIAFLTRMGIINNTDFFAVVDLANINVLELLLSHLLQIDGTEIVSILN